MSEARVSRRSLLQITAAGLLGPALAACSGQDHELIGGLATTASGTAPGTTTGLVSTVDDTDADLDLVLTALGDEQAMLEYVAAARAQHRMLADALDPWVRIQRAHVDALRESLVEPPPQPPSSTPHLPRSIRELHAFVARQLRGIARRRLDDCLAAESGALAGLFASMAASHSVALGDWEQVT